jgi:uracil-DNA glycosylase family protein
VQDGFFQSLRAQRDIYDPRTGIFTLAALISPIQSRIENVEFTISSFAAYSSIQTESESFRYHLGMSRSAFDYLPEEFSYPALRDAAAGCRGCDLYKDATQTVFGEGDLTSGIVFVGEQPGDEEDIKGHPFVGPAGRLLDKALVEAGIDRQQIYLTNAVKHFKWKPQGKRRLHERPKASEIAACDPWLRAELMLTEVKLLVCLGATAAQSLFGRDFRVTKMRGQWLESDIAPLAMATIHPSAILRAPSDTREGEYRDFVADLSRVSLQIASLTG